MSGFRDELQAAINRYSQENGSNTPDWVLADYLANCLLAFDNAVNAREKWYGRTAGSRLLLTYVPMECPNATEHGDVDAEIKP